MTPSARTSAAAAVLGDQLLLHGGMLVSKSVAGRLSQDTFCLNLSTWTWTRMAASQERAVGSTSINVARASHMAVAVPAVAAVMLIGRQGDTALKAKRALNRLNALSCKHTAAHGRQICACAVASFMTSPNILCTGGTNNRQAWASCDSIECLRQIGGGPVARKDSSDGISAAVAAAGMGLSGTPTLLGIQPFAHVTNTPRFMQTLVAGEQLQFDNASLAKCTRYLESKLPCRHALAHNLAFALLDPGHVSCMPLNDRCVWTCR